MAIAGLVLLICFQVGRFFGEVDGSVMASLIKMGMYRKWVMAVELSAERHPNTLVHPDDPCLQGFVVWLPSYVQEQPPSRQCCPTSAKRQFLTHFRQIRHVCFSVFDCFSLCSHSLLLQRCYDGSSPTCSCELSECKHVTYETDMIVPNVTLKLISPSIIAVSCQVPNGFEPVWTLAWVICGR